MALDKNKVLGASMITVGTLLLVLGLIILAIGMYFIPNNYKNIKNFLLYLLVSVSVGGALIYYGNNMMDSQN
jgi:hypothetical protein